MDGQVVEKKLCLYFRRVEGGRGNGAASTTAPLRGKLFGDGGGGGYGGLKGRHAAGVRKAMKRVKAMGRHSLQYCRDCER